MEAKIEKGNLVITIPANIPPVKSNSGKTMMLASSHGNQKLEIEGVTYWLGLNCYTYAELLSGAKAEPKKKISAKRQREIEEHNKKVTEGKK